MKQIQMRGVLALMLAGGILCLGLLSCGQDPKKNNSAQGISSEEDGISGTSAEIPAVPGPEARFEAFLPRFLPEFALIEGAEFKLTPTEDRSTESYVWEGPQDQKVELTLLGGDGLIYTYTGDAAALSPPVSAEVEGAQPLTSGGLKGIATAFAAEAWNGGTALSFDEVTEAASSVSGREFQAIGENNYVYHVYVDVNTGVVLGAKSEPIVPNVDDY